MSTLNLDNICMTPSCSNRVESIGTYCPRCLEKKHKCVEEGCSTLVFRKGRRCLSCAAILRHKQQSNPTPLEETIDYSTYIPTPEQIRKECEDIRAGWDEDTLLFRTVYKNPSVDFNKVVKRVS